MFNLLNGLKFSPITLIFGIALGISVTTSFITGKITFYLLLMIICFLASVIFDVYIYDLTSTARIRNKENNDELFG